MSATALIPKRGHNVAAALFYYKSHFRYYDCNHYHHLYYSYDHQSYCTRSMPLQQGSNPWTSATASTARQQQQTTQSQQKQLLQRLLRLLRTPTSLTHHQPHHDDHAHQCYPRNPHRYPRQTARLPPPAPKPHCHPISHPNQPNSFCNPYHC